jgi:hypothetical protein
MAAAANNNNLVGQALIKIHCTRHSTMLEYSMTTLLLSAADVAALWPAQKARMLVHFTRLLHSEGSQKYMKHEVVIISIHFTPLLSLSLCM